MTDAEPLTCTVECDGTSYCFLFDTGAAFSAIDSPLVATLNLPAIDSKLSLPGIAWHKSPAIKLGTRDIALDGIAVIDMTKERKAFDMPLRGILGMDVLSQFVTTLNPDDAKVTIATKRPPAKDGETEILLSILDGGRPHLVASLGRTAHSFLIDTGNASTMMLSVSIFDKLTIDRRFDRSVAPITTIGMSGVNVSKAGVLKEVSIGQVKLPEMIVSRAVQADMSSSIGMNLLSRFQITLDIPGRLAILRPSKYFAAKDVSDIDGMTIEDMHGRMRVSSVRTGEHAWQAGLRPGDEITSVDGTEVGVCGVARAAAKLTRPRIATMLLDIRRLDKSIRVSL